MTALEKAIIEAGHSDFFNGVFISIGGGVHEAQTVMVRSVTPDASSFGKLFDEYFDGKAEWADEWLAFRLLEEQLFQIILRNVSKLILQTNSFNKK